MKILTTKTRRHEVMPILRIYFTSNGKNSGFGAGNRTPLLFDKEEIETCTEQVEVGVVQIMSAGKTKL